MAVESSVLRGTEQGEVIHKLAQIIQEAHIPFNAPLPRRVRNFFLGSLVRQPEKPKKTKSITPIPEDITSAVEQLGIGEKFDITMTVIGGAEFNSLERTPHLNSAYDNAGYALIAVASYLAQKKKRICLIRTASDQGIMRLPNIMRLLSRPPYIMPNNISQIGVYPSLAMYTGEEGVTFEEYEVDAQRKQQILSRLDRQKEHLIPVKSDIHVQHLDPTSPTYEADIKREWQASADVLTSLPHHITKKNGNAVTILFNGGTAAAHEVAQKLKQGEKVIVIKHSGRLSTVMTQLKEGRIADSKLYDVLLQELGIPLEPYGVSPDKIQQYLQHVVIVDPILSLFGEVNSREHMDLSTYEFHQLERAWRFPVPTRGVPVSEKVLKRTRGIVYFQQVALAEAIIAEIENRPILLESIQQEQYQPPQG